MNDDFRRRETVAQRDVRVKVRVAGTRHHYDADEATCLLLHPQEAVRLRGAIARGAVARDPRREFA